MSRWSDVERQVSGVLLIVFASLLVGMVLLDLVLNFTTPGETVHSQFVREASLSHVMPMFLAYLVVGAAGFWGTVGLVETYGQSLRLTPEVVRLSALAYFLVSYWLWSAVMIVRHKITLLTDIPTNPPDWLLQIFDASDALYALGGWGSFGPAIVLFVGLWWLLTRGARLLPRVAGWFFLAIAIGRFLSLVYIGVGGFQVANIAGMNPAYVIDVLTMLAQIVGFLLAGAAVYTEKGVFVRSHRV
ncbi:MAG: hypothetical protein KBD01_02000 [Acidobacteria bacterium]|nr:hypothetical protein [Acidobacteriota bacterium]